DLERRLGNAAAVDEAADEIESANEEATVRGLLLNLDGARERYRRFEQLFDEGLTSRQSLEDARLALNRAETEPDRPSIVPLKREQARNRLNDMAAERIPFRLTLSAAYHDLEQCRLDIARRGIVSPIAGRVTALPSLKPGEFLSAGAMVATITGTEQTFVVEV